MSIENKFYVYVYLDPRKQGKFVYGKYSFNYEPFYIGKGFGDRWYGHLSPIRLNSESHLYKTRKIKKINESGYNLRNGFIIKIKQNLKESTAFKFEKLLINLIGRHDLGFGPLTNLTDGGEGSSNPSKETRLKLSLSRTNPSQETRNKRRISMLGKNSRKHTKEENLKSSLGHMNPSFEIRKKNGSGHRKMNLLQCQEIIKLYDETDLSEEKISKIYKVSRITIHRILKNPDYFKYF